MRRAACRRLGTALRGSPCRSARKANFPVCSTPISCTACGISALVTVTEKTAEGPRRAAFRRCDYCAKVFVNGELAGTHKGGYVSFEFDVTALLKAGENEIAPSTPKIIRATASSRAASRASNITHTAASRHTQPSRHLVADRMAGVHPEGLYFPRAVLSEHHFRHGNGDRRAGRYGKPNGDNFV